MPYRVLLVEGCPADVALFHATVRREARGEFVVQTADSLAEALTRIAGHTPWDLVVLDVDLPDASPEDAIGELVAEDVEWAIVVLTGLRDDGLALRAIQAGAQDYVVKGTDGGLLVRTLRYAIERHRRIASLRRAADALEWENCELIAENVALEVSRERLEQVVWSVVGRTPAVVD